MRALRWVGGFAIGTAMLVVGGLLALVLALDAGTFTPRIAAAIQDATGRAATLGSISLQPGLTPRLVVEGASLANLPGGSRPEMAKIRRLEVRVALLSLLRGGLDIEGIDLDGADILLERLADGTPNWVLTPAAPPAAATPESPPAAAAQRRRRHVALRTVRITDSRVTLPDPRLGTLDLVEATVTGVGTEEPARATGRLVLRGLAFALEAEVAPATGELRATLTAGTNRLSVEGRGGVAMRLTATLPRPSEVLPVLAGLLPALPPGLPLPPAEAAVTLDERLRPTEASLRLGAADLSSVVPGLALTRADLRAPALDLPAELTLEGRRSGLDIRARIRVETPGLLLATAPRPLALSAEIMAAGASATLSGTLARPREAAGAAFNLRLTVPDLTALAQIIPDPLPLTDLRVEAQVEAPRLLAGRIGIPSFRVASPLLAAQGALTIEPGAPLGISGRISAQRVDLDGLGRGLVRPRPAAAAPAAAPAVPPATPAPAAPTPAQPAPAQPDPQARVIPDIPLPLATARAYRGRVEFTAAEATADGMTWRDLRGTVTVADGHLRLQGASVVTPGGRLHGEAGLNTAGTAPEAALTLRSEGPGLDLGALARARGDAPGIEGHAELRIEVRGRGATLRAVAATLDGEAGIAIAGGRIVRAGMQRLGPDLLRLLLPGAPSEGLPLRCLALRASAEDGLARTEALFLESGAGEIAGAAAVNLRTETLAARLMPDVTLLGLRIRAPVGIGGTLASPQVGVEPGRALTRVIGDTVANRLWRSPTVEWLRGQLPGRAPESDCAAQLRLARFGAEGPVPPPERVVPGVPRELQGTAHDLLRGLGGLLGGQR